VIQVLNCIKYVRNICASINKIDSDIVIPVIKKKFPKTNIRRFVIDKLTDWMVECNSRNWIIACHMVQFTINNTYNHNLQCTPYEAVFGQKPNVTDTGPVSSNCYANEDISNINDENPERCLDTETLDLELENTINEFEEPQDLQDDITDYVFVIDE
jgi:hypothetical protein